MNRQNIAAYLQLLGGSGGRIVSQILYFWLLVQSLSLAEYGVFASAIAISLILGTGGAFGFCAPLFRGATARRRLLGHYLGGLCAWVAVETPIILAAGAMAHTAFFDRYLSLPAFLAIVFAEAVLFRLVDACYQVNIARGRYARGAIVGVVGTGFRALAALGFALFGDGSLEEWIIWYVTANVVATAFVLGAFLPRAKIRFDSRLFVGRLPEAFSFAAVGTIQALQTELDKLVILGLTDETSAGIYALSMRLIEIAVVPLRTIFPIYVKALIRRRERLRDWAANLRVEATLAAAALGAYALLVGAALSAPDLVGDNIVAAVGLFGGLFLVVPARVLTQFHMEIFFAANRLSEFFGMSLAMITMKTAAIAAIATAIPAIADWSLPLNLVFASLYAASAAWLWRRIFSPGGSPPPAPALQRMET